MTNNSFNISKSTIRSINIGQLEYNRMRELNVNKANQQRILTRNLATELTKKELEQVVGGHTPPKGETCSGNDCDTAQLN